MSDSVALRVQRLKQPQQVLVLSRLAADEDNRIRSETLLALFDELGVPRPKNLSSVLGRLRDSGRLTRLSDRTHRLSPEGRAESIGLLSAIDVAALSAESAQVGRAQLGQAATVVLPPYLAPPELIEPLRSFLDAHPFDTNVFGMTRFPDSDDQVREDDPIADALNVASDACAAHGLEFHLASDRAIHRDLWTNVAGHMWASRFGIAFFEDRRGRGVNYNLTIEVGSMLMAGRRCALLKDTSIDRLPTDLVGQIYKAVDLTDAKTTSAAIHSWIRDDLDLSACPDCSDD